MLAYVRQKMRRRVKSMVDEHYGCREEHALQKSHPGGGVEYREIFHKAEQREQGHEQEVAGHICYHRVLPVHPQEGCGTAVSEIVAYDVEEHQREGGEAARREQIRECGAVFLDTAFKRLEAKPGKEQGRAKQDEATPKRGIGRGRCGEPLLSWLHTELLRWLW